VTAFLHAGDRVRILRGPRPGDTREITHVRMFATDAGYYLRGGDGLYAPSDVELVERAASNPCGTPCDARTHDSIGTCDHCLGTCHHATKETR